MYKKEKKTSSSPGPIMWHRYAKRLCPSSSRCKDVANHRGIRGRTSGTMCTRGEIERGTHAHRVSKLGPVERGWTRDGKLEILPPESGRRTHLLYFTYSYCILSVSENLPLHCLFYVTMNIYFCFLCVLHVTSSRFCLYLLNIYLFTFTFSHAHTEAHTHKHTCIISTQEEWRQPGTGAWLRGAEERLLLETKTLHTQNKERES